MVGPAPNNLISTLLPNRGTSEYGYNGGYYKMYFEPATVLAYSDVNNYIPFYALGNHNLIQINTTAPPTRIMEYVKINSAYSYSNFREYENLMSYFIYGNDVCSFMFRAGTESKRIKVFRGALYTEEGKMLVCLCVDKEVALVAGAVGNGVPANKYTLLISKEFRTDTYKNVKKKFETMYVSRCLDYGVNVMYVDDIDELVFKNSYTAPRFSNIGDLNRHLQEDVPAMLLT